MWIVSLGMNYQSYFSEKKKKKKKKKKKNYSFKMSSVEFFTQHATR